MKYFLMLFLFGCSSIPHVEKEDCYSFHVHDMNQNLGRQTIDLYVYDIRKFEGKEYILFRDIDIEKGFKYPIKEKFSWDETSGLVWMWSEDFYRTSRYRGNNKYASVGWNRFSYLKDENYIRNGVHCNPIPENDL